MLSFHRLFDTINQPLIAGLLILLSSFATVFSGVPEHATSDVDRTATDNKVVMPSSSSYVSSLMLENQLILYIEK